MMTKAAVTYLCSDGVPHVYDAADRKLPLCGADVFIVDLLGKHKSLAPACEDCAFILIEIVEGLK
jgi:hypothetical protein